MPESREQLLRRLLGEVKDQIGESYALTEDFLHEVRRRGWDLAYYEGYGKGLEFAFGVVMRAMARL